MVFYIINLIYYLIEKYLIHYLINSYIVKLYFVLNIKNYLILSFSFLLYYYHNFEIYNHFGIIQINHLMKKLIIY